MIEAMTPTQEGLVQYVNLLAEMNKHLPEGLNDYRFITEKGKLWTPQVLPPKIKYGEMRMCFQNAYRLAKKSSGKLRYCEGIAHAIIPTHHAWCVDWEGNVVDPTWRTRPGDEHGHDITNLAYYGVAYDDINEVMEQLLKNGHYGLFFGNKLFK